MDQRAHWDEIYRAQEPDWLGWYQLDPEPSLTLLTRSSQSFDARILDVGGGASLLVDRLLDRGYTHLSVLDVSGNALSRTKDRLDAQAGRVNWIVGDVTDVVLPPHSFDIWHDRAVFHFLTDPDERARYVTQAYRALAHGGALVIATFAEDGPTRCSGFEVMRYSPAMLAKELSPSFALEESRREIHLTPSGVEQSFVYCLFRRSTE